MKTPQSQALIRVIKNVRACDHCEKYLPHGVRPVLQANHSARILVAGQAPGSKVHESGVPFDDRSGDRLRQWMGIDKPTFYDANQIAILPMGFCYPGTGKSGDLAPRKECAELWRNPLLKLLPNIQITLAIGQYAQHWHIPDTRYKTLTKVVEAWEQYWPGIIPLPHPSPRNNIWLKKNPWFEKELVPILQNRLNDMLL